MYSPDGRKEWYLEECRNSIYEENTADLIERIFVSTELEEMAFEKDICDFTDDNVIDLFKSFNSKSRARLKSTAWYLSRYHKWCYDKGLTQKIDDAFDDRTIESIIKNIIPDDMLLSSYYTKENLIEIVELDPDYINRFIILGLFYGIKGDESKDLLNVKIDDLNEEEKTITLLSGRKAFVDDYFIDTMKKASEVEEYKQNKVRNHRNYKQTMYVNNGFIIRQSAGRNGNLYDNKPVIQKFIISRLQKFKKEFETDSISISSLYKNGLINYIKEKYAIKGISLKTALTYNDGIYVYDKETQSYIDEYDSKTTVRFLRMELKDIIDKI